MSFYNHALLSLSLSLVEIAMQSFPQWWAWVTAYPWLTFPPLAPLSSLSPDWVMGITLILISLAAFSSLSPGSQPDFNTSQLSLVINTEWATLKEMLPKITRPLIVLETRLSHQDCLIILNLCNFLTPCHIINITFSLTLISWLSQNPPSITLPFTSFNPLLWQTSQWSPFNGPCSNSCLIYSFFPILPSLINRKTFGSLFISSSSSQQILQEPDVSGVPFFKSVF